jgi:hypothetical protein
LQILWHCTASRRKRRADYSARTHRRCGDFRTIVGTRAAA